MECTKTRKRKDKPEDRAEAAEAEVSLEIPKKQRRKTQAGEVEAVSVENPKELPEAQRSRKSKTKSSGDANDAATQGTVAGLLGGAFGPASSPKVQAEEAEDSNGKKLKRAFSKLFENAKLPPPVVFEGKKSAAPVEKSVAPVEKSVAPVEKPKAAKASKVKHQQMSKEEKEERKTRTVFVGNVPLDWTQKTLKKKIRAVLEDKYKGSLDPIWFHGEPLKFGSNTAKKLAHMRREFSEASDAKNAYVVVDSVNAVRVVTAALNGTVADDNHILRADGLGEEAQLRNLDRKRSVFVGNLPRMLSEAELRSFFSEIGDIAAVRIPRDKETQACKGIAFVLFKERTSVKPALALYGTTLKEREIRVQRVTENSSNGPQSGAGSVHRRKSELTPELLRTREKKRMFKQRRLQKRKVESGVQLPSKKKSGKSAKELAASKAIKNAKAAKAGKTFQAAKSGLVGKGAKLKRKQAWGNKSRRST